MKRTVKIEGIDPVGIAGVADANLKIIEDTFPCEIFLRGNTIRIGGEEKDVMVVEEILSEMMNTYTRKNKLNTNDVRSLIALISEGDYQRENQEPVILYTSHGAIKPRTKGQREYYELSKKKDFLFSVGPAGTGKTYLAVAFAIASLKRKEVKRIVLTRPAVEAGERLGFLPGDLREKIDPYLTPLYDALNDMIPSENLKTLMQNRTVEVIPLAYMRGRTLNSAFVILDEAQNCSTMQMKMFLTRLGPNSKAIITGDITQIDLPRSDESGLIQVIRILKNIDGIGFSYTTESDVVRHKLVKEIIKAYNNKDRENHHE
ncbi:MAG: PhoH family protein [Candidatus Marinimicrobia bacterium]|nr:PhoH family protein [Candidatus Neomarinimicrobiota bacterium]